MPRQTATRRRVVQIGGGLAVLGTLGTVGADSHDPEAPPDEPTPEEAPPDEPAPEMAQARVAHLSPDAPPVDVFVDGEPVLEDVPFRTVSDYLDLEPGEYQVQAAPAGEGIEAAVIDEVLPVPAGAFSAAAIGEVSGENQPLEVLTLEDDISPLEPETARVRAVHASPDAPAVDLTPTEGGEAIMEGLAYGEYQSLEVPAGDYTIFVYPTGERDEPVTSVEVTLEAGTASTGWAIGYLDPEAAPADEPFEILLTEDATPRDPEEMPPEEPPAEPPEEPPAEPPEEPPAEPPEEPPAEPPEEPPADPPAEPPAEPPKKRKKEKKSSCGR